MGIAQEQSEKSSTIRLEGAIDIASAAELKKLLLQALASGHEVCVSLKDVTDLDVTTVQLLWAARREAEVSGVGFAFLGQAPEIITSALCQAGFTELVTTMNGSQVSGVNLCQQ